MSEMPNKTMSVKNKEQLIIRKFNLFDTTFKIGGYKINLLDAHYFPGHVNKSSSKHIHSFYEIHVPIKGSGKILINDKTFNFKVGTFVVTTPDQVHEWVATKPPVNFHIWWFEVLDSCNNRSKDIDFLFKNIKNPSKPVFKLPQEYNFYYTKIIKELDQANLGYQEVSKQILSIIFMTLLRSMSQSNRKKTLLKNKYETPQIQFVNLVNGFLEDNLSKKIDLEDLAKTFHISKRSLMRRYKNNTGITIGRKLIELRMYYAEELIRETELQIKAVAHKCGFPNLWNFTNKFKDFFQTTPSKYRKEMEKQCPLKKPKYLSEDKFK